MAKKKTMKKSAAKAAPKAGAKTPAKSAKKSASKSASTPATKPAGSTKSKGTSKASASGIAKNAASSSLGKKAAVAAGALVATAATIAVATKMASRGKDKETPKSAAKEPSVGKNLTKANPAKKSLLLKKGNVPRAPSSRMTLMKLGFSSNEQAAIIAAPHGFKVPDTVDEPATLDSQYDFILIFVENLTEAEVICASLCPSIRAAGRAWVAWPKGGASDIELDQLSGMVEAEGLVTVTHLSLDEKWSAVKFMHPKNER